jgi:hypothetical protein
MVHKLQVSTFFPYLNLKVHCLLDSLLSERIGFSALIIINANNDHSAKSTRQKFILIKDIIIKLTITNTDIDFYSNFWILKYAS